ncbi:Rap1 GTPase-activating protein 2 [Mortierella sp. AM989]|nr:Rap1 GTPase-activating protein 2 [Mortierella sp. AM989]
MTTLSTTQKENSADIKFSPTISPMPLTSSPSSVSAVPSVSSSPSPTTTQRQCPPATLNYPTTSTLVHNHISTTHTSNSPENNCINMPNNHNIVTSDNASIHSSSSSDHDTGQPIPSNDTLDLISNNASLSQNTKSRVGSKSFGFFGSLSPKNSKQRLSKRNKKESSSASPSSTAIMDTEALSPSAGSKLISSEHNANNTSQTIASPSRAVESKDGQQQCRSSDNRRHKDKENQHQHLGQRISKAIGLTSSSSKGQQRGRRESDDSLSATDHSSNPDESHQQREVTNPDKDKKGGLVSQFFRHRVLSATDLSLPRSHSSSPASQKVDERRVGGPPQISSIQNNHLTIPPQPPPSAISTMNSDAGAHSVKNEKNWQTTPGRNGFGYGGGGSGKSVANPSFFKYRRSSLQIQIQESFPQSIADIMESSREVHPHHSPSNYERQDLCNRLGLQEIHHRVAGSDGPIESMNNHMYSVLARRRGSYTPGLTTDTRIHILSQNNNLSASNSSIDSGASATSPVTSTKPPSRLARLTRFKFPSLSVGSMHKNKSSTALSSVSSMREPTLNNIRRGSLPALMISSHLESFARKPPIVHVPGPASVNTTGAVTLVGIKPGSNTHISISSKQQDPGLNSVGDGKKSKQSLSGFMQDQSHYPHHSSTAISKMSPASTISSFSHLNHRQINGSHDTGNCNTLPQHIRSSSKTNFGSERFTSSTSGSHDREQGQQKLEGNGFGNGIRSSTPKRASRRTVSASHISSDSIFAACEPENTEGVESKNLASLQSPVKQVRSEWNMQSAALLRTENDNEMTSLVRKTNSEAGSVGQYLFGNELKNMTFGDADVNKSATKADATEEDSPTALSQPMEAPPSSNAGSAQSYPIHDAAETPLKTKKSSSSIKRSSVAALSSFVSSGTFVQHASPHPYDPIANTASSQAVAKDHMLAARISPVVPGDSTPVPNSGRPLLSSANVNAKIERHAGLSQYTFPPRPTTPAASAQLSKSKLSSLLPGRQSFSHNNSSGSVAITSALNLAASPGAKASMKSTTYPAPRTSLSRNPNIPHLEPRSAVADYTPIIHYKRQRSMSLQDADLLTADQFIALMPDDLPSKRRFSSEEATPESNWFMAPKIKKAPLPDPSMILRSLVSTLQSKCALVIKHLDSMATSDSELLAESTGTDTSTNNDPIAPVPTAKVNDIDVKIDVSGPSVSYPRISGFSPAILSSSSLQTTKDHSENQRQTIESTEPLDQMRAKETITDVDTEPKSCAKVRDDCQPGQVEKEDGCEEHVKFSKDSLDIVSTLFDDMYHTVSQMTEVMAKYIPIEQFSNLSRELDDMCFLAQTVIRTEIDKRGMQDDKQEKGDDQYSQQEANMKTSRVERDQSTARKSVDLATTAAAGMATKTAASLRVEVLEAKQVKSRISMDKLNNGQYKHQRRQHSGSQQSDDSNVHLKMTGEEQQQAVRDYILSLLSAAETCFAEYMRVYNRMFVVPTAGYRIEGCNDLKKIERALHSDNLQITSPPLYVTASGGPHCSLLSKASAVQNTSELASQGSSANAEPSVEVQSNSAPYLHPSTSSSSINLADQPMARVKGMPESNKWDSLQNHKEIGGDTGIAGAISMGTPASVEVGSSVGSVGGSGLGTGVLPGPDILTLGDYSKEHMGHEAYYYRNWFLGKEHRTYVGQVEGLGTVIISIIKDMVVPTESRPAVPGRFNTGPLISSSMASNSSVASTLSLPINHITSSSSQPRPELVHSAHSFYTGRGSNFHSTGGGGGPGGGLIAGPRASSEAMRIILSASAAVVTGSGSIPENVSSQPALPLVTGSHFPQAPSSTSSNSTSISYQANNTAANHNSHSSSPPRWQYRCILRQKDVDSLRITLPEPELSPLNNLTRRVGKPQWKNILQSIHPAITQQVASKLKKVQTSQHFEKELAKFDETMLRFNYKFGVLLVHPGQTKEEDWFSNQMTSSPRFQEFLDSGALGQKVNLKGFERFSAGLDTRSDTAGYSYFDTWGEGFEIMYHVSTLLPFNTGDRQQIQRKRHIGNDIVCIVFVDGDHPFIPSTIKSQFLHIFVVIHPISLPDGTRGYSAAIACDDQVPQFGPPLPDPPIFRSSQELRSFLLCKMINGENAAYKAPRLIKPHQRARSGMLENLVSRANCLTKDKDSDKKKQQKAMGVPTSGTSLPTQPASISSAGQHLTPNSHHNTLTPSSYQGNHNHQSHYCIHHGCQDHCPYENDRHPCCGMTSPAGPPVYMNDELQYHPHAVNGKKVVGAPPGPRTGTRASLVSLGSETAASIFRARRRNSNSDMSKTDAGLQAGAVSKEKEHNDISERTGYIESLQSPGISPLPSPPAASLGSEQSPFEASMFSSQDHDGCFSCCGCCSAVNCYSFTATQPPPNPYADYKFPPPKATSTTAPDRSSKFEVASPQHTSGISALRVRSEVSPSTETQFSAAQDNFSHPDRSQTRHSVGGGETLVENSAESKDNSDNLGMSINNNKGRSKSDIDLLLKTAQEGSHNAISKRSALDAATPYLTSSYQGYNQGRGPHEIQQHHRVSSGSVSISHAAAHLGSSVAVPAHSSMKGRAHYFLTTLVRRRASSNDTSALGPNIHLGSKPSNLSLPSPLGTWSSTHGHHPQARAGNCQHHHHNHGCQLNQQKHHHHHHHHHHHLRPRIDSSPSQHPHYQESSDQTPSLEQPLRFKEGYKTPMQIDTAITSSVGTQTYSHHQLPSPSASTASSNSSLPYTCNSPPYTCSSLTSASLRSSTGTISPFSFASSAMSSNPLSISGVSPRSLRSFSSKDALNRVSFSTDRRASIDVLGTPRSSTGTPIPWSYQRSGREDVNDQPSSVASSADLTSSSEVTAILGDLKQSMDAGNQAEWKFSESPKTYTPTSIRPMDSMNSIVASSYASSTPASASASEGLASSFPGSKTDYMNFKPIASSQDVIPRLNNNGCMDIASEPHVRPLTSASAHPFGPTTPSADQTTTMHLPMKCLALRESRALMAIDSDLDNFPSTTTFASIPSSASANTTAADIDISPAELAIDLYDESLMENPVANKVVKRAASVESFLRRDGVLARMASLHLKGTGLQESIKELRRPNSEALLSQTGRIDPHYQRHSHPLVLGDHGLPTNIISSVTEKDGETDKRLHFSSQSQSLDAPDTNNRTTIPSAMQLRTETRLRKISESQNSHCSLEAEQLDVNFEVVTN